MTRKRALALWLALLVAACSRSSTGPARADEQPSVATPAPSTAPPSAPPPARPARPTRIAHALREVETARGSGSMHRFRIPLASAQISFVDLQYRTPLVEALAEHDLVINGGYWAYRGRERAIQGLLVVAGRTLASRAKTLSGGILHISNGRAALLASDAKGPFSDAALAIQCSPRLVVAGRVVPKLEAQRVAARTALCVRDDGRVLDVYLTDADTRTTLPELASFLLGDGCEGALNLDGGPSTAAAFRDGERELRVGTGLTLPYALGFVVRE